MTPEAVRASVYTAHLPECERRARTLRGALPSMQEHRVISPSPRFPEMLTRSVVHLPTLPRQHLSMQTDAVGWQGI